MATEKRIKAVIQIRRAKKSEWEGYNPILRSGEPGVELDTKMVKVGDGETPWNQLPYIGGAGAIDYETLPNKPRIEDIELRGNKTLQELGVDTLSVQDIEKILYAED